MPHAVIEYSDNLSFLIKQGNIPRLVHEAMVHSGLFTPTDIKTRAYSTDSFLVGTKGASGTFIHITVSLLEGRTPEQRQRLSDGILEAIRQPLKEVHQVSIDIRDMVKDTYRKLSVS